MRKRYETPASRATEERVMAHLRNAYQFEVSRTPDFYELDLFMRKPNGAYAYGEVKGRTCCRLDSPFYIVSQHKWIAALRYASTFGISVYVFFLFADHELGTIDIPALAVSDPPEIFWSGRRDRNDDQDMEPCVKILNSVIRPIATLPPP